MRSDLALFDPRIWFLILGLFLIETKCGSSLCVALISQLKTGMGTSSSEEILLGRTSSTDKRFFRPNRTGEERIELETLVLTDLRLASAHRRGGEICFYCRAHD